MHWRVLARRPPYYHGSRHIVQNERTVTKINGTLKGSPLSCYVVQIAAKTVAGIDTYVRVGDDVARGAVFGMIRIGSQVDIVVPWRDDLRVHVEPGDRVRAGETLLVD
jgi:phosphatidylserine decarboxylase